MKGHAFAHASRHSGTGVRRDRDTTEIMRAEDVGWAANKIVLGRLSGRNASSSASKSWVPSGVGGRSQRGVCRVQELADRKEQICDRETSLFPVVDAESVTSR